MNNSFSKEIVLSIILIILLVFLINPFGFFMPSKVEMMIVLFFLLGYALFLVFVWKEKPLDEREEAHRLGAGRSAFLSGVAVIVVGILVQTFSGMLDPWLIGALGATILGKIGGLLYNKLRK